MECGEVKALLTEYLTGELDAGLQEAIERHREECPGCRNNIGELEGVWKDLAGVGLPTPASGARGRFDAVLAAFEQGRRSVPWSRSLLAQAAIAVFFLIGGVWVGLQSAPASEPGLDELRVEIGALRELVAESMLQQRSASQRLRGVSFAAELGDAGGAVVASLLDTLEADPNVNVRLAVVEVLGRFAGQMEVRTRVLETLPYQRSPLVQVSLIDLLVDAGEARSIPVLERIVGSEATHPAVRDRAVRGISELG